MNLVLQHSLPGIAAHRKMAPPYRVPSLGAAVPDSAIRAAVLAVLAPPQGSGYPCYEGQGGRVTLDWQVLVIRRAVYAGVHSGQIALPGGKRQAEDMSPWETAIRETREEVGIHIASDAGHVALTNCYVLPSNTLVQPFAACVRSIVPACPDGVETTDFRWLPISLCDPQRAVRRDFATGEAVVRQAPCWAYEGYVIWGATAIILCELHELVVNGGLVASGETF